MNLEQFRQQLSNDYQQRCEKQEITIKELHSTIAEQATTIGQLQNRCYVMSGSGAFCPICGFKDTCKARIDQVQKASKG